MTPALLYVLVLLLGPVFASFLSVVIHRVPRKESIAWPGSHCPACGHRLGFPELVPILGWLASRGRCRHCGAAIARRYLVLELLLPALLLLAAWRDGPSLLFVRDALLIGLLVVLSFIDLETMELPHRFTWPAIASGLLFAVGGVGHVWSKALMGAFGGYLIVAALSFLYRMARGKPGMGGGDAFLLGAIGAHTGPLGVLVAFFAAVILGSMAGLLLILRRPAGQRARTAIPFGPFLAAGGLIALYAGEALIGAYLRVAGLS